MTKEEIINNVDTFLIDRLEFDAELIKPEAHLHADLGMTSLDIQETKIYIKRTLGFVPERQDMLQLSTLEDLYSYIEKHIEITDL